MSKFTKRGARANVRGPIATTEARVLTHEGGVGWSRDAKSELFLLAVSNMVGEDTFYESASKRDSRFVQLVHQVVSEDPAWVAAFTPYLRETMHMRTASVVMAAEYVKAGGPNGRAVINSALQRADEPAEFIGYWQQNYGRALPMPVKRGVGDAVKRLYNQTAVMRYDSGRSGIRFADVIALTHPKPRDAEQSTLFRYLLDKKKAEKPIPEELTILGLDQSMQQTSPDARRGLLRAEPDVLSLAHWPWERLSGWLPGGMDAEAWEAVIPNMGYMALLRNLRNFDEAHVSDSVASRVAERLADPAEVARSKQFPFRFLSAWREIGSLRWAWPLEQALELSLQNIPQLAGRTLILVDLSGSMWSAMSGRSQRQRWEIALLFGVAVAKRAQSADLVLFGTESQKVPFDAPLLKLLETYAVQMGGTNTMQAINRHYAGHDRLIVVTDEQAHDAGATVPPNVLTYTFNVAGYRAAHLPQGERGSYVFGGLTDAGFELIPLIESQRDGAWPFL